MSEVWGNGKTLPPAVTDPVVVDGMKYRIRSIEQGGHTAWRRLAYLRATFRPRPGANFEQSVVAIDGLTWDKVAGVWRVKA